MEGLVAVWPLRWHVVLVFLAMFGAPGIHLHGCMEPGEQCRKTYPVCGVRNHRARCFWFPQLVNVIASAPRVRHCGWLPCLSGSLQEGAAVHTALGQRLRGSRDRGQLPTSKSD